MSEFIIRRLRISARSSLALLVVAVLAAVALPIAHAWDCFQGPDGCKYGVTNPCPTYPSCPSSVSTCSDGRAMWTSNVMLPPTWNYCNSFSGPLSLQCTENWTPCGTTQWFYDSNCSMYCNGNTQWYACLATGNNCIGG